jgi:hypothetical protein
MRVWKLFVCLALVGGFSACSSSTTPPDGSVITCVEDEQCPAGLFCDQGICRPLSPPCDDDGRCPAGQVCVDGRCLPEGTDGGDGQDGLDGEDAGDTGPVPDIEIVEPSLTGSPPQYQLDFGNVLVGVTVSQRVVVRNAGSAPLRILQLNFELGTDVDDFTIPAEVLAALPIVVAAGQQTSLDILYTASDGLTDHGILDIISNDPDEPLVKIHLLSEFKGTASASVSPASLAFGDVALGQSSQPLTATLSNQGTGNAVLTVSAVRFGVLNNPDFSLALRDAGGTVVRPPLLLNNGDALDAQVVYHPQLREVDSDELVFVTDDPIQSLRTVALGGRGVVGDLGITPSPVALGRVRVGERAEAVVTISNAGGAPLTVSGIGLEAGSGEWSLTSSEVDLADLPQNPLGLTAGQSVRVSVGFEPADIGQEQTELWVDNSTAEPRRVAAVSASGYVPPAVVTEPAPPVLQFGNVQVDFGTAQAETKTLPVVITNAGGEPLRIDRIQRAASTSVEFTWSPASIPPIDLGLSVPLNVHFTPAGLGGKTGALLIDTNDPDLSLDGVVGRFQIELAANGIDPTVFVSPASQIAFGPVYVGQRVNRQVSVRNAGSGPLQISSIALSPGSATAFSLLGLPQLPLVISNPMTEVLFEVEFVPAALGAQDVGVLVIESSDLGNPRVELALSGAGADCPLNTLDCNGDPQDGCEVTCVPSGPEQCNGRDDDCDCLVDEDFDLDTDPAHCGACNAACSYPHGIPGCANRQCFLSQCQLGWDDCNGSPADGCETPLGTTDDCAGCDHECRFDHAQASCLGGTCVMGACEQFYLNCNTSTGDGCEVFSLFDADNCGACNRRCLFDNAIGICSGGNCFLQQCLPNFANCDGIPDNGCEVNLMTDPAHCGSCPNVCQAPSGTPVCVNGTCGVSDCNPGFADCNGLPGDGCEIQTSSDPVNCGGCGQVCDFPGDHASFNCVSSSCVVNSCEAGWGNCDGNHPNGCETDTTQDSQHCGYCGNRCTLAHAASFCQGSLCRLGACDPGYHNIDNDPTNGCECAEDGEADLCQDAIVRNLGTLGAGGQLEFTITNNLIPWVAGVVQDEDWYTFTALDDFSADLAAGIDRHHLRITFDANGNPGAQYAFMVYRADRFVANKNCSTKVAVCDANGSLDYSHFGQNPCWRGSPPPSTNTLKYCGDDDSAKYWIRVYRVSSLVNCSPYILKVTLVP